MPRFIFQHTLALANTPVTHDLFLKTTSKLSNIIARSKLLLYPFANPTTHSLLKPPLRAKAYRASGKASNSSPSHHTNTFLPISLLQRPKLPPLKGCYHWNLSFSFPSDNIKTSLVMFYIPLLP